MDDDYADVTALGHQLLRLQRRRTVAFAGSTLEISAFRILWVLSDGEPRTLRQIGTDLDLEQSTVNRQVNAAIAAGYLERFDVPGQASKMVRPTERGRELYDNDGRVRAARYQQAIDTVGVDRARRLIDDLRAFNDAFDAALEE
ncbi:MarR family winged helix-turn-helix transcriptional regulator [Nocardioides sp. R-C-SC26]|uniref:MarR family winged helix-turn-helix transcriptional regulator n=1 Tax=Nocardioides sp. R-C-SC26 TaxID=2870414 RepID=UPI001E5AE0CD|nr:MarR family winged helix-turn-helix transcriptional regulator [Nocardioides sp. R-C-SC26]